MFRAGGGGAVKGGSLGAAGEYERTTTSMCEREKRVPAGE